MCICPNIGRSIASWLALASIVFVCTSPGDVFAADPRTSARFYVDSYGLVDAESDPRVGRAEIIFKHLIRVSNRPVDVKPGLRVIESDGQPWAIALPDGYVIISRGTLEVCYKDTSAETGDARLALILGHELAHLTQHDFWHRDVHLTLKEQPDFTSDDFRKRIATFAGVAGAGASEKWQEQVRHRELMADDQGFMFASLAGFSTAQLLQRSEGNRDFFDYWVTNTRTGVDNLHANPAERASLLRARFFSVKQKVDLFDDGVRLLTLGRLDDAISLFRAFSQAYPAAAVNSNLGFAFLHKAFQSMRADDASRYWLPGMVDTLNPLVKYRSLGQNDPSKKIREHLETAVAYLEKAAEADSDHLASRINLSTAHWFLGNYHKARAVVEEARRIEPDNTNVLSLRALTLYLQEQEIDMWPISTGILKNLATINPVPLPALFNLARLMEQRSRLTQASIYWTELYKHQDNLPEVYRQVVCEKAIGGVCRSENISTSQPGIAEILIGRPIDFDAEIQTGDQSWRRKDFTVDSMTVTILDSGKGLQLLLLDDHAEMVVLQPQQQLSLTELEQLSGPPLAIWQTLKGELRIYPKQMAVATENNSVTTAWWGRPKR